MTTVDVATSLQQDESNLLEKHVQTYLSDNLALLGIPGLTLVEVEYALSVGRVDILAEGPDQLLVAIETKRDLATREDVGQLQSYMGALQLDHPSSTVRGILIAAGLTDGARAALVVAPAIDFYTYHVQFTFRQKPLPKPEAPPVAPQSHLPNALVRTESRYCIYCRRTVLANVMGNADVICTQCKNNL